MRHFLVGHFLVGQFLVGQFLVVARARESANGIVFRGFNADTAHVNSK